MTRKKPVLDTLIDLSRRARDEAAGTAASARQAVRKEQEMMQTLHQYRQEYAQSSPQRAQQVIEIANLERHRRFVERLDLAVQDQQQRQGRAMEVKAQTERVLNEAERRMKAFETLQARQRLAAARKQARREQQMTDEQAALLARRHQGR